MSAPVRKVVCGCRSEFFGTDALEMFAAHQDNCPACWPDRRVVLWRLNGPTLAIIAITVITVVGITVQVVTR